MAPGLELTHAEGASIFIGKTAEGASDIARKLESEKMYEMRREGVFIRGIARELELSRDSVRKYLRSPGVPVAKGRPMQGYKPDP